MLFPMERRFPRRRDPDQPRRGRPAVSAGAASIRLIASLRNRLLDVQVHHSIREVAPAHGRHGGIGRQGNSTPEIDQAVRQLEHEGVDVLLVICLSYSPSQLSLPALQRTYLPIVVWNTQELFAVDETFDGARMIANHGVHGTQDLCNVLLRE